MKTLYILTVLVALVSVVSSVLIKKERCQFAKFPKYYTSCKNDATICSDSGGEFNPCEGDTPDPENMYFCTAEIPDIPELKRPWVKCSDECFDANSDPKEYDDTTSCSAVATTCKFPFKVNEKTYTNCTDDIVVEDDDVIITDKDGTKKQTFKWCATSVNENQIMKKDKWGRCDESTYKWESPAAGSGGLSGGAICGIIIGIIAALATVAVLVYSKKENKFCFQN